MNPNEPIDRREFAMRVATTTAGALALGVTGTASAATGSGSSESERPTRGIAKVIRYPKALESPANLGPGETWRYLLSYPFQVAPNLAGLYANLKNCAYQGQDFESGQDIILFDRRENISAQNALPITRAEVVPNPNNGGKPGTMAKYPGGMGFIPLGAKLPNGRPHPHAGTGFSLITTVSRPTDKSEGFATFPDRIGYGVYTGSKYYSTQELYQLSYDGNKFAIGPRQTFQSDDLWPGYTLINPGMGCAIADGEDLIIGTLVSKRGGAGPSSGVMRWSRTSQGWRPTAYEGVTPEDNSHESTLVRDLDGSLLFHARGRRSSGPPVRLWRRAAGGGPWQLRINKNGILNSTPVTLNRAVDGTPFLASNLYQPPFQLPLGLYSDGGISRLEPMGSRGERSTLCIWPLNESRDDLAAQLVARDPRVEFGLPPHGTVWACDHGTASPVRLADGQWHTLMGYRLLEWKENTHFIPPSPQTGSYLDEVISFGEPAPLWNF